MADPPPPPNQRPPNPDDPRESVEALATELGKVVKVGLPGITTKPPRALFVLESVRRQADKAGYPDTDDGRALGLRDVVKTALDALGPGTDGDATRLLFGAVADSAGRNLGQRRTLAANLYDIVGNTFRQGYEPRLVREVAVQMFRLEHQPPDLQVITNPDPDRDRPEPSGEAAPLHVVIDTPGTALALHATAPTTEDKPRLRGPRRLEWVLLALIATGVLWWQWGPGGVLRGLAVALIAGLAATIAGAVRGRDEAGGIGRALLAQAPRLAWLGLAVALSVGGILADNNPPVDPVRERRDPCAGITPDPQCTPTTDAPDEPTQAELSPNHVPTTLAPVPAERSPAECPPEGNKERRLSFVHGPPLWCIDPTARYEATVQTNFGDFKILLNTERSPVAVNNFAYLVGWHFYDGVTLKPSPEPLINASGMRATDPVAEDDTDKVPGYGLTFDRNTWPDLPVSDDERVYVVVSDVYKASRWLVVITDNGASQIERAAETWPLIGQVSCGVDVIANDGPNHDLIPAYTSADIVIDHITIRQLDARETPELHPRENCE